MSDITATATGRLVIDASGVDTGISQAGEALNALNDMTQRSFFALQNLGLGFEAVGAAATAGLAIATTAAMNWDAAMAVISVHMQSLGQTSQDNARDTQTVSNGLKNLAETSPYTVSSILNVSEALAAQGVSAQNNAAMTKAVLDANKDTGASVDSLIPFLTKMSGEFGTGQEGAMRLTSALIVLSNQTRALPTDIITLAQGITAAGRAAGLSAVDIVGLSAGFSVMEQNNRLARSGLIALISGVEDAATHAGTAQNDIARVSGESAAQFVQSWQNAPGQAIAQLVTGLGQANISLDQQKTILTELGLPVGRQQQALLAAAAAQKDLATGGQDLLTVLRDGEIAWNENTAAANAANRIYNTSAAQMQEFHNTMTITAQELGSEFLPIINVFARAGADIAAGFGMLGPVLGPVVGLILVTVGAVGVLGGAFFLLLPRIAMARDALVQLTAAREADAAATKDAAAVQAAWTEELALAAGDAMAESEALGLSNTAKLAYIEEALVAAGADEELAGSMAAAVVATEAETAATVEASIAVSLFGAAVDLLSPELLAVGAVVLALTGGLAALGMQHRSAAQSALDQKSADEGLMGAMQQETQGVRNATDAWILHSLAVDGSLTKLMAAGLTASQVINIIKGSDQVPTTVFDNLEKAANSGDAAAAKAIKSIQGLHNTWGATAADFNSQTQATKDMGAASSTAAGQVDGLGNSLDAVKTTAAAAAKAIEDIPQAEQAVASTANQVYDAEQRLAQARQNVADKSLLEQQAVDNLAAANADYDKALATIADDEQKLADARTQQQEEVDKASLASSSADIRYQQSILAVTDAQTKLNGVSGADTTIKLAQATNALADARLKLQADTQTVADAEWQLQYLQNEGASQRDIQNAQFTLASAQQAVADQTTAVDAAQQKLTTTQDQLPVDLTKATLDLQQAQISEQQAALASRDANNALLQAQTNAANDTDYHNAVDALAHAHSDADSALLRVHSDTLALHAIQNGSVEHDLKAAEDGLIGSLAQHAQALATLKTDTDIANGGTITAADKVKALSSELMTQGNLIGGPVGAQLINWANMLDTAAGKEEVVGSTADTTAPKVAAIGTSFDNNTTALNNFANALQAKQGIVDQFIQKSKPLLMGLLAGPLGLTVALGKGAMDSGQQIWDDLFKAEGGVFFSPTMAVIGEAGPEVLIPLTDPSRAAQLAQQSGLMSMLSSTSSSAIPTGSGITSSNSSTDSHDEYHDHLHVSMVPQDPQQLMQEWTWARRSGRTWHRR